MEVTIDEEVKEKSTKTYPATLGTPRGERARLAHKMSIKSKAHRSKKEKRGERPELDNSPVMPFDATLAYAFRQVGGKVTAIEASRLLAQEDVRFLKIVTAYDLLTEKDKDLIRLEDLCAGAEISPGDFLGEIIPHLWKRNVDIAKMVAAVNHPKVVERTIDFASGPFGGMDRKMLLEASGFLPTSKGMSINIDNSKKTLNAGGQVIEQVGDGMPTFEEDGIEIMGAIRGDQDSTRMLPAPSQKQLVEVPKEEIIDAELVNVQS